MSAYDSWLNSQAEAYWAGDEGEFDSLFEDAKVTAIVLPDVAFNLGYHLVFDGTLYTGTDGNGDRIGQWANEQEALKAMLNAAIAEATEIDLSRPWTDEDTESLEMLAS